MASAGDSGLIPIPDAPPATVPQSHNQPPDKDDVDTCRICRGESTPDEPLFYPCKCSGSIKYVHQECLMEWLSHSQKKYCELCKTSFRFTKLYHPGMPNTIPTSVFLRRAAVHILKLFMTWCRAVLVASVWLILLPWCMRVVWRSLFWVGDGGWNRDDYIELRSLENGTSPSSVYDLNALHSAYKAAQAANQTQDTPIPSLLMPFSHTLNTSAGEPGIWTFAKRFLWGFITPLHTLAPPPALNRTELNATADHLGPRNPSLLSDVSFFNWFPSQAANGFLVDVLEGQIITLAVVVVFILIFLIREWVVQQQPVINMVALNGDAAAAAAEQEAQHHEDVVEDEAALREEHAHEGGDADDAGDAEGGEEDRTPTRPIIRGPSFDCAEKLESELPEGRAILEAWHERGEPPEEMIIKAFEDGSFQLSEDWDYFLDELPGGIEEKLEQIQQRREDEARVTRGRSLPARSSSLAYRTHETPSAARTGSASPSKRPHMPVRGRSSLATDVKRRMEEDSSWSFANVPEAAGDNSRNSDATVPNKWDDEVAGSSLADQEQGSDHSSESWQQVPDIVVEGSDQDSTGKGKGKGKDVGNDHGPSPIARSGPSMSTEGDTFGPSEVVDEASNMSTCGSDSYRNGVDTDAEDSAVDVPPQLPQEQHQENDVAREAQPEPAPGGDVQPPRRTLDRILDWMFDGVAPGVQAAEDGADDAHIVRNIADEAPFVPFAGNEPREVANQPIQDPEVAAAAAQAGIDVNDQDAIDDAEDLEGILELIGMQGPLTGLFQNAMFSAVLISATLACAVWLPYLWGKVVILFMGSPVALFVKLPLQIIATLADLLVDSFVFLAAVMVSGVLEVMSRCVQLASQGTMDRPFELAFEQAKSISANAALRLWKLVETSPLFPPPTYFRLSIHSHEALRTIQNTTSYTLNQTSNMVTVFLEDAAQNRSSSIIFATLRLLPEAIKASFTTLYTKVASVASWLLATKTYKITFDLDFGSDISPFSAAEAQWTATDRLIAVLAGYAFFALAGAVYLKRGGFFSSSSQGMKIERIITEILQQAGGVLKVILIISIEMLVFPLYCGLLLDMALLPLFKDANLYTRWQFTRGSPWTSGFVHWFIGTCYMFHFALFVSMCRKIMRRGVLYFIRDPDDPQFHPVRDVLERSVTTQLRKIAFSGLVYGALVIVCLGGVVWTLNRLTTGVLPIHWVSHAPSLELPLDLLFYNFLTPVIIKLYKPSDALQTISGWWFKLCARFLRLSNFLFGERAKDQEGRKVAGEFVFEGRYVRAPASDQVRIPKGDPVFVDVDADNVRKDGLQDAGGVHNSNLVAKVYIPPWFRLRIGIFVFTIWIFAAVAGVSATIIPLLFGRYLFSLLLPATVEMNDIHSFSLGLYTLGSLAYSLYHLHAFLTSIDRPAASALATLAATASRAALRALRFAYVWGGLILLIPFLFAVLIEFYGLIPLHAYLGPKEPHVVHLIQDWTLGFLYARLVARLTFADRASRPARAFAAVIRDGYLNPNAQIATRCFLLPALALFVVSIIVPSAVAITLNYTLLLGANEMSRTLVWRFAFPSTGAVVGMAWAGRRASSARGDGGVL
ncbi:uncharacterized protein N0V89_003387 [Didymosphaeria variabile]|uniref:RING-type E3 ubiquitin transferase n=1 Tax=Didymosphaeria variabile TaxID=1932322 RepID=A0A9W8XPV0_9PLEO|nr:uncharacterized protein N0V89_003387 [Didymosphaeria variabile]KAJ4355371.1 hypothetical protein N0V89_003387 [Didymosphaeria variabile]